MISFQVEFTIEDYIIEDWLESNNYESWEFEEHVHDFIDEYFATTIDNVTIL